MIGPSSHSPGRRHFLQAGTLALFAGAAPGQERADSRLTSATASHSFGRAKRCILVYLLGGPPQIDMWDMKPEAPAEIRGPFKPIASPVVGMRFCEHLPRLAARAGDLAILRSVTFPNNDHPAMIYHTLTGRELRVPLGANTVLPPSRSDDPHMGAVVSKFKHRDAGVPGYVAIPEVRVRMMPEPWRAEAGRGCWARPTIRLRSTTIPREPLAGFKLPEGLSSGGSRRGKRCWPCSTAGAGGRVGATTRPFASGRAAGGFVGRGRAVLDRESRRAPTVMAATALGRVCCWPGGWSSGGVVRRRALQLHDEVRRLGHAPEEFRGPQGRAAASVG